MRVTVPTQEDRALLLANHMDPERYGVTFRDEDRVICLYYKTRDTVLIRKPGGLMPTAVERRILQNNGMDPDKYGVLARNDSYISLICLETRTVLELRNEGKRWL